jgi:predicted RNase H-like nuclease (RuvC/YqgF family)
MEPQSDLTRNVVELRESIKIFDQRISQLKDTIKMVDQNNLEKYKEIKLAIQSINNEISSSKTKIFELEDAINRLERQSENFAKSQDIKVIEKYLSFVDPSRFLNKEDVIKIVNDYMNSKKWS